MLDHNQTSLLLEEIKKMPINYKHSESNDILYHWRFTPLSGSNSVEFRDKDKNLLLLWRSYSIHLKAGINPNWVWDWEEPKTAMTYSITCYCISSKKNYGCKTRYDYEFNRFHAYSRTLDWLMTKFEHYIARSYQTHRREDKPHHVTY